MYELMVEETFDAAHALRGYEGPCENLHGHTWKVQVFLEGDKLNNIGLLEVGIAAGRTQILQSRPALNAKLGVGGIFGFAFRAEHECL